MIVKSLDDYHVLFENAPDLLYAQDLNGQVLRVNRAFERATGYDRSEVIGKFIYDLIAPDGREPLQTRILERVGGAPSQPVEVEIITRSGRLPVELFLELLFRNGRPVAIQGFGRDISDRLRARFERAASDSALLRQTEQLATFSRYLQLLHRLSTTHYAQIDDVFSDYLSTGCEIFKLQCGAIFEADDGQSLRLRRSSGRVPAALAEGAQRVWGTGATLAGPVSDEAGASSFFAGVPLIAAEGQKFGVLAFWSADHSQTHPQAREIIEMMARGIESAMQHRRLTEELERRARLDSLTGLPNRAAFLDRLQSWLADAGRLNEMLGVIFADLDRFKEINDRLGHDAGDTALLQVARRLATCESGDCLVARVGGDEFAAVVRHVGSRADVIRIAEKLRESVIAPIAINGDSAEVALTYGVSVFPDEGADAGQLLRRADQAMYKTRQGRLNSARTPG